MEQARVSLWGADRGLLVQKNPKRLFPCKRDTQLSR